jgi:hypothetical protein
MSFNLYYDNRARYKDLLREAEKERLIRKFQLAKRDNDRNHRQRSRSRGSSWSQKISLASKDAGEFSAS